ncbi:hypothetical protein BY996DRAFT_7054612, partial [Phakopsora pachyrhizi]
IYPFLKILLLCFCIKVYRSFSVFGRKKTAHEVPDHIFPLVHNSEIFSQCYVFAQITASFPFFCFARSVFCFF